MGFFVYAIATTAVNAVKGLLSDAPPDPQPERIRWSVTDPVTGEVNTYSTFK